VLRAIATAAIGFGMTLASTFAGSLGLNVHDERWLFGVGVFVLAVGVVWLVYDLWSKHRGAGDGGPAGGARGGHTVVSHGQQGGITAHTVNKGKGPADS
jgi:hypothetical protein